MAQKTDLNSTLSQLETTMDEYLVKKAPALPKNIKDILVAIIPWFTLIGIVLLLPLLLAAIGISAIATPFAMMGGYHGFGIVLLLFILVEAVLEALALPALFKKQRKGWLFLFYARLISVVALLFSLSVGGILGALISFYFLFQVKEYYK